MPNTVPTPEPLSNNDFMTAFSQPRISTPTPQPSQPDFSYLKTLNPEQEQAVKTTQGPLLVTAGAGSGKTRVLTSRIAYMIQHDNIAPETILAITFTRKAANEMQERLAKLIPNDDANKVTMGTFHKICADILRNNANAADLNSNFTIADDNAQRTIIKTLVKHHPEYEELGKPKDLVSLISRFKDALITPDTTVSSNPRVEPIFRQFSINMNYVLDVQALYQAYQNELSLENAIDFGDMISRVVKIFTTPHVQNFFGVKQTIDILPKYQSKYQYILIDEYQDTNPAQYKLVQLLAGKNQNVCAVGDADQSIYGWRGADINNIFNFKTDFKNAKEIKLQQNYRSTNTILTAASQVIHHNTKHTTEKLWSQNGQGDPIQVYPVDDTYAQTDEVVDLIHDLHDNQHLNYNDIGILYRTNRSANPLDRAFVRARIPHTIVKGQEFYNKAVVQNYLAYFTILTNPAQSTALQRIINRPARKISPKVVESLSLWAGHNDTNLYDAIEHVEEINELTPKQQAAVKKFRLYIHKWQEFAAAKHGPQGVKDTVRVMEKAFRTNVLLNLPKKAITEDDVKEIENRLSKEDLDAYRQSQQDDNAFPDLDKFDVRDQFMTELNAYATTQVDPTLSAIDIIQKFLEDINLQIDDLKQQSTDSVQLMTVHTAKGLEFDTVILVDFDEKTFPTIRSLNTPHDRGMAEERRLAYVAYTRAKRHLYIFTPLRQAGYSGKFEDVYPSRFIYETPFNCIQVNDISKKYWFYLKYQLERELGHEL